MQTCPPWSGGAGARGSRVSGRGRGYGVEARAWTVAGGGASRRCCASFRSARVHGVSGVAAAAILVSCAAGPHLSFIAQCDGGPPAKNELGHPRPGRGCEQAHRARWDPMVSGRSN
jgi:hypothetical protein